jgi:hypothetical protein
MVNADDTPPPPPPPAVVVNGGANKEEKKELEPNGQGAVNIVVSAPVSQDNSTPEPELAQKLADAERRVRLMRVCAVLTLRS